VNRLPACLVVSSDVAMLALPKAGQRLDASTPKETKTTSGLGRPYFLNGSVSYSTRESGMECRPIISSAVECCRVLNFFLHDMLMRKRA